MIIIKQTLNQKVANILSTKSNYICLAHVRALLRKTGVKLPRYAANLQLFVMAISLCHKLFDKLNFVHGLHVGDFPDIDDSFIQEAEKLVKDEISKLPRNKSNQPVIIIRKNVVIAANKIYSFNKQTNINLFNTDNIERFHQERVEKIRRLRENNQEKKQSK